MPLSPWIRNLMSAIAHRNCRHDWAPSHTSGWVCVKCGRRNLMSAIALRNCRHDWAPSHTSGWVCVKCGRREDASTAVGDPPV